MGGGHLIVPPSVFLWQPAPTGCTQRFYFVRVCVAQALNETPFLLPKVVKGFEYLPARVLKYLLQGTFVAPLREVHVHRV